MEKAEKKRLLEAIAVTAEVMGTELSEAAAMMFLEDLGGYEFGQITAALTRCRREVKGRLVVSDVISRIDDGRPGVEVAWSMFPRSERDSVVWSDEMRLASAAPARLLDAGDEVAARMAFKEAYTAELEKARASRKPVKWSLSAGFDVAGRAAAIGEAQANGRISLPQAKRMLEVHAPSQEIPSNMLELIAEIKTPLAVGQVIPNGEREQ